MSKPRRKVSNKTIVEKEVQVLPRTPCRKDSDILKVQVEVELDKFTKGLEQYEQHNKMSKEKESAELEQALQKRRVLKSRDGWCSTRKNFNKDKEDYGCSAKTDEQRIAEELQ